MQHQQCQSVVWDDGNVLVGASAATWMTMTGCGIE